jgi:hypothetical protein
MGKSTKLWEKKEWVVKRYVLEKKTVLEMATEAKCSHMTIQRALERFELIKKPRKWTK